MERLHHNGVLVPPRYEGRGLAMKVGGEEVKLTPEQEEMAVAWARKMGTPYVEDPVFARNFHRNFSAKLGIEAEPGDVDYSEVLRVVEEERAYRACLTREERRRLAAERKARREANKERYGFALVDGSRMEVGNYTVEPSSIFMGRGSHPMRGRWKEGPREEDIELNLSPDAPRPPGDWRGVVWKPEATWIARWRDKLGGNMKYVWLSESSFIKQKKDIEKFEKARELRRNLEGVQRHILENLDAEDLRRRKMATVCYLIDRLKFRVGDEKDEEEADTVGASTLRPEHIHFNGDGTVTFDFLGKDSVPHVIRDKLPEQIVRNLKEFSANASSTLFDGVDSKRVSSFLDEVMTGLSAKVFRTCYSSESVEEKLYENEVDGDDPEYVKKHVATLANLEAAKVCNHKRTIPKSWERSLQRKEERLEARRVKAEENVEKHGQRMRDQERRYRERLAGYEEKLEEQRGKLGEYIRQLREREEQGRSTKGLRKRVASKRKATRAQRERIRTLKKKHAERMEKLKQQMRGRKQRDQAYMEKLRLQIKAQRATRDYNLGTSLKSYIDPRIYYEWGRRVDYDWKKYYPKALRSKFSWVEADDADLQLGDAD
ncbi:MAG: DNA topoisomerase I [Candidatus Bathyarchaeota archaeon]|nr:DNA topoisomerase I [Candidatus Bathyarchaeota archaeon]